MKKKMYYFLSALFMFSIAFVSCEDDDDKDDPFVATQTDLDAAVQEIIKDLTGGGFPHGGPTSSGDSTYRDIYANRSLSGDIPKGTIVTKHTFRANSDGSKSNDLLVTFAMIKREEGYDSDAQNWEYVMMPYDANNNYTSQPNGTLPAVGNAMRGPDVGQCKSCHAKAGGGDYLYVND